MGRDGRNCTTFLSNNHFGYIGVDGRASYDDVKWWLRRKTNGNL
jgi:hypothetical protein